MFGLVQVGLVYDIAGVVILGVALALVSDERLRLHAGTYLNFSMPALRSLLEQRMDARFGLTLLVFGFMLQLAGGLGVRIAEVVSGILIGALIPLLLEYRFWREGVVARRIEKIAGKTWPDWQAQLRRPRRHGDQAQHSHEAGDSGGGQSP